MKIFIAFSLFSALCIFSLKPKELDSTGQYAAFKRVCTKLNDKPVSFSGFYGRCDVDPCDDICKKDTADYIQHENYLNLMAKINKDSENT